MGLCVVIVNKELWDQVFDRLRVLKSGVKTHTGRGLIGVQTE